MNHKSWCDCKTCEMARETKRKLTHNRRKVPLFVIEEMKSREDKKEAEMLAAGYLLKSCSHCGHTSYTKIGPMMKCGCCGYDID